MKKQKAGQLIEILAIQAKALAKSIKARATSNSNKFMASIQQSPIPECANHDFSIQCYPEPPVCLIVTVLSQEKLADIVCKRV